MVAEKQEHALAVEKERMRYVVAATNPRLFQLLFPSDEEEGEINWTTPQTPEEVDELLTLISEQQVASETTTS